MVAHLIDAAVSEVRDLLSAVQSVLPQLEGAYALAVVNREAPDTIVVARQGSPLVLGVGIGENFAGSDTLALRSVTDTFIYLEDGDVAEISADGYQITDSVGASVERVPTRLVAEATEAILASTSTSCSRRFLSSPLAYAILSPTEPER